jgi:hypothetical protein
MEQRKFTKRKVAVISALLVILLAAVAVSAQSVRPVNAASALQLSCTGSTPTTLTLSWTKSDDLHFSKYALYMAQGPNDVFAWAWTGLDQAVTSAYFSNLNPFSYYCFYIVDVDAAGNQSSNLCATYTAQNPALTVTAQTADTVTVTWTDNNVYSPLIPFRPYTIQISTADSNGPFTTITTVNEPTQNTYKTTGLNPGTYYLRMYETAGTGFLSYSNTVTFSVNAASTPTLTSSLTPTPTASPAPTVTTIPTAITVTQEPTAAPTATPTPDTGMPILYVAVGFAVIAIVALGAVGLFSAHARKISLKTSKYRQFRVIMVLSEPICSSVFARAAEDCTLGSGKIFRFPFGGFLFPEVG